MDFIVWLPTTGRHHDAVWVIMDRLTKLAHFLAIATTFTAERLAELYLKEIVWLREIPSSIVSDRIQSLFLGFGGGFSQQWVLN